MQVRDERDWAEALHSANATHLISLQISTQQGGGAKAPAPAPAPTEVHNPPPMKEVPFNPFMPQPEDILKEAAGPKLDHSMDRHVSMLLFLGLLPSLLGACAHVLALATSRTAVHPH